MLFEYFYSIWVSGWESGYVYVCPKGIDSFNFSYSKKIDLDKKTDERAILCPPPPPPFTLNWPTPLPIPYIEFTPI